MRIIEMTATFGRLQKATLRPGERFTLVQAPNESGKSTWCAFLRAMLYGFPPRDRDKAGYLAEKTRYQPWSGAAMEGCLTLEWQGRSLTLRRGPKGSVPWGAFSAVWTASQLPVEGLTGDNCGEVLLGVPREVFERTAFVGQGEIGLSPSAELEKQVTALATSGEEDVSFSQVERRLKDWLNRRKVNSRVGLIPELEEELAQVEDALARQASLLERTREAREEKEALEQRKAQLGSALRAHAAAALAQQAQRRRQAQEEYDAALAEHLAAQAAAQALPPAETLRQAQGDVSYSNTLTANLRLAEKALADAREAALAAQAVPDSDPLFASMDPAQAAAQAQRDRDEARRLQKQCAFKPALAFFAAAGLLFPALASLFLSPSARWMLPVFLPLAGVMLIAGAVLTARRRRATQELDALVREKYNTPEPDRFPARAGEYAQAVAAAQEAQRQLQAVENERDKLAAQLSALKQALLKLVHPFAPQVTDLFGVSAALSRALQQEERLKLSTARLDAAQRLLSALPAPQGDLPLLFAAPQPPQGDPEELKRQLEQLDVRLARVSDDAARLEGELASLGAGAELAQRQGTLREQLALRREEYDALTAAMESLRTADSLLRERFSPAVNQKTGAYLAALTGGRYDRASLSRQFQAAAQHSGETAPRQDLSLSTGAAQQLYLAARLAMCELALPQEDPCPILLDDVLDAFDDDRAKLALECLLAVSQRRQVILFSCHSRDRALLAGRDAAVTGI